MVGRLASILPVSEIVRSASGTLKSQRNSTCWPESLSCVTDAIGMGRNLTRPPRAATRRSTFAQARDCGAGVWHKREAWLIGEIAARVRAGRDGRVGAALTRRAARPLVPD